MAKKARSYFYKSYVFRDKDPVIDELRTLVKDKYGNLGNKAFTAIHQDGGPTTTCMSGWFFGTTRRPQSATVEAAGRAIGYKRIWQRMK
jgi:hypothetical protein